MLRLATMLSVQLCATNALRPQTRHQFLQNVVDAVARGSRTPAPRCCQPRRRRRRARLHVPDVGGEDMKGLLSSFTTELGDKEAAAAQKKLDEVRGPSKKKLKPSSTPRRSFRAFSAAALLLPGPGACARALSSEEEVERRHRATAAAVGGGRARRCAEWQNEAVRSRCDRDPPESDRRRLRCARTGPWSCFPLACFSSKVIKASDARFSSAEHTRPGSPSRIRTAFMRAQAAASPDIDEHEHETTGSRSARSPST